MTVKKGNSAAGACADAAPGALDELQGEIGFLMKTFAAVAVAAFASAGCVVPVAGPAIYSDPGIYGRVDIGNYPPPPLVYSQPVIIAPPRFAAPPPPLYLYVPPGHHQNWQQYCGQYNACGRPVYFVRDPAAGGRYQPGYQPGYRSEAPRDDGRRWQDRGGGLPPAYRPLQRGDPRVR